MITIIFAPPRTGKTSLMTHLLNESAYDRNRIRAMQSEIARKNDYGFNLTIPPHPVSANYDITFRKFRYPSKKNRIINPYRLGFANPHVETHFNLPYEVIGITEAQKYLNSRMSKYYPDWQSRWYEQHGHNNLDIFLDTQRPMLIDVNIRELSSFIDVLEMTKEYNERGSLRQITWYIRRIPNSQLFDRYMSSGKRDEDCYVEDVITSNVDVFNCYDSQSCKPKFYAGHFADDFDYDTATPPGETPEDYIKYLQDNDDELPDKFYTKKVT